jgi:hypothetical protein
VVPSVAALRRYSGAVTADEPEPGPESEVVELQHEVEALRQQNDALRQHEGQLESHRGRQRWKAILSWVLLLLACLLAVVSVLVVFARNEVLNTDSYVRTVTPLASDPAVQAAVAKRVSANLIEQTNLEQRVKNALPARAGFLATPITSGVENATDQIALKVVQTGQFQRLWVAANRRSHKQMVALLTGSTQSTFQAHNGEVSVDLTRIETQVKRALDARGITVFDKVPTLKGPNLVLLRSTQLAKIQRLTRALDRLALLLPIVTVLLFAAAVLLTRNRRRGLVRAAGGLALSMALVLVLAAVIRNQYLSSLLPSQSKAAAAAVFDALVALLLDSIRTIMIVAAIVALVALAVGNRWVRAQFHRPGRPGWLTDGPVARFLALHRKGLQWTVLGLGLVVLVVWTNPTAKVAVIVVLVTLALVGLVGLVAGRRPAYAVAGGPGPTEPPLAGGEHQGE